MIKNSFLFKFIRFICFTAAVFICCNTKDKSSCQYQQISNRLYKLESICFKSEASRKNRYDSLKSINKLPSFEIIFEFDTLLNTPKRAAMRYVCNRVTAPFKASSDTISIDFNETYGTKVLCMDPLGYRGMFSTTTYFTKNDTLFLVTTDLDTAILIKRL